MLESHQVRPDIAAQPALARHRKQLIPERLGDIRGQAGKAVIDPPHDRIEACKGSRLGRRPPCRLGLRAAGNGKKHDPRGNDEHRTDRPRPRTTAAPRARRPSWRPITAARRIPTAAAHNSTPGL